MEKKHNIFHTAGLTVLGLGFAGSLLWGIIYVLNVTGFDSSLIQYEASAASVGVLNEESITVLKNYEILDNKMPSVSAKSFLVGDLDTGEIILSNDAKSVRPIASISKLMTALVAKGCMSATSTIVVSREAKVGQCTSDLKVGNKITLDNMFYPLLLASNNEAAEAIAITYGRENFIKLMNDKAAELGLSSTKFNDPSGLSPQNLSSADDLFLFAKYLYENQSDIISVTKIKQYKIQSHSWTNISKFINDADYLGGKNGFTDDAGQTLVAMFKENVGGEDHNIVFVLLDGINNKNDINSLILFVKKYVAVKNVQSQNLVFN